LQDSEALCKEQWKSCGGLFINRYVTVVSVLPCWKCLYSRARPMYRHTDILCIYIYISADMTILPMYRIGKIPPIYIGNICS